MLDAAGKIKVNLRLLTRLLIGSVNLIPGAQVGTVL